VAVLYTVVAISGFLMLVNSILGKTLGSVSVHNGRIVIAPPDMELEEVA
jgi:hypothetical protein